MLLQLCYICSDRVFVFSESDNAMSIRITTVYKIIMQHHSSPFSYSRLPGSTQLSIQHHPGIISAWTSGDRAIRVTKSRRDDILCLEYFLMCDGFIFMGMGFHFKIVHKKEKQNLTRLTCYCSTFNALECFCILCLGNERMLNLSMRIIVKKIKR
jgi:hypothetical protein